MYLINSLTNFPLHISVTGECRGRGEWLPGTPTHTDVKAWSLHTQRLQTCGRQG